MLKLRLPVVNDEEIDKYEQGYETPEVFHTEDFMFYSVDFIGPYHDFENLCVIGSGGAQFVVGKPQALVEREIDRRTRESIMILRN
jgi:hypothetical protein